MKAIEGFYHPSNTGRWAYPLAKLLQFLAQHFLKRLHHGKFISLKLLFNTI